MLYRGVRCEGTVLLELGPDWPRAGCHGRGSNALRGLGPASRSLATRLGPDQRGYRLSLALGLAWSEGGALPSGGVREGRENPIPPFIGPLPSPMRPLIRSPINDFFLGRASPGRASVRLQIVSRPCRVDRRISPATYFESSMVALGPPERDGVCRRFARHESGLPYL